MFCRVERSGYGLEAGEEGFGFLGGIGGLEEVGDDDDVFCAGGEDFVEVVGFDTADAIGGDLVADGGHHFGDLVQADGGAAFFGGGGVERAETDVVKALGKSGLGLGERVGGTAVNTVVAKRFFGRSEVAIVLAKVETVSVALDCEVDVVVDDKVGVVVLAEAF